MPNPNPRRGPYSGAGRMAGRQRRRFAKEESVVHYLGDGKQGAEQVAFIQQLLNKSDPAFLKKVIGLLNARGKRFE